MSDPSAAMFHKTAGGNIDTSELITSGHDTTVHRNYYNLNIGVFPDVIGFFKTAAQPFVTWTRTNQSTAVARDSKEHNAVEISSMVPSDPSSFPVSSIADSYTRSMLECKAGYPLYEPEPFSQHSKKSYSRNGVTVGDVGFVREDGSFDFLFNICPPHNGTINPPNLPDGFSLKSPGHSETRAMRPLAPKTCFFPTTVTTTESGEYICEGSEGAVLELPEGAIQDEAIDRGLFAALAKLHGVEWYKYTMIKGRDISNGSLYLVTSFTKCNQWGIAVFNRRCHPGQGLTFVSSPLGWKGPRVFPTKVADSNQRDIPNQCVFLRGYKIMIRQDIFDNLCNDQPPSRGSDVEMASLSPQAGSSSLTFTRQRATRIRGGGGPDPMSGMITGGNPLTLTTAPTVRESDEVVLHANFNSSPAHPSDLINVALLSQYPNADIALTHDDVWCDLLRDNFPKLNYTTLRNISQSYTSTIDEYGCVTLENASMSPDPQIKKELSDEASLDNTSMSPDPQIKKELSDEASLDNMFINRQMKEEFSDVSDRGVSPSSGYTSASIYRSLMMPRDLTHIPLTYFPIWGKTLDYKRGLPSFRVPPEFSEEGILTPDTGGYTYETIKRHVIPASSRLSPSGKVEIEEPTWYWTENIEYQSSSYPTSVQAELDDIDDRFHTSSYEHSITPHSVILYSSSGQLPVGIQSPPLRLSPQPPT